MLLVVALFELSCNSVVKSKWIKIYWGLLFENFGLRVSSVQMTLSQLFGCEFIV